MSWRVALALAVGLALAGGCHKRDDAAPATEPLPAMPAAEAKRGQDACKAYVAKVCSCADTIAALKQPCSLSRALPEAIEVGLSVATNPDSTRRDVLQANDSVRKVVKECIEETAKLPSAGCP
jgi:hypothetical protein